MLAGILIVLGMVILLMWRAHGVLTVILLAMLALAITAIVFGNRRQHPLDD